MPGIKVLAPATVDDARHMLAAALADPDPVVIFEHAMLYPTEGEHAEDARPCDPWRAVVRRPGRDVALVTYGGSLPTSLAAADELARQGIDVEVLDLRSLRPLDVETILRSVAKTHRAAIVDEGWRTCGLAAEISAIVMEGAFYDLDAPVVRICTAEVPIPYARHLEEAALPSVERIVAAIREAFRHDSRTSPA